MADRLTIALILLLTGVMLTANLTGCGNNDAYKGSIVVAEGPVKVFRDYPDGGLPEEGSVIAVITKGETAEVIRNEYSKEFMFYRIRLTDNREGYVQYGDKFRVVPGEGGR